MDILKQLFSDDEIEELLEYDDNIKNIKVDNTRKILKGLADMGFNTQSMRFIISTYPFILLRDYNDINELIVKVTEEYRLNKDIFVKYPYIFMKDAYEIDMFMVKCRNKGMSEEDAITLFNNKPYMIDIEE